MLNLIGTYECKADVKGRVMVPVALKKQLSPAMADGFVVKLSAEKTTISLGGLLLELELLSLIQQEDCSFLRTYCLLRE